MLSCSEPESCFRVCTPLVWKIELWWVTGAEELYGGAGGIVLGGFGKLDEWGVAFECTGFFGRPCTGSLVSPVAGDLEGVEVLVTGGLGGRFVGCMGCAPSLGDRGEPDNLGVGTRAAPATAGRGGGGPRRD